MPDPSRLIGRFGSLRVAVIGDVMLDVYLDGVADRLCREGPVPVIGVSDRRDCPGGAGNAAVNLRALGAEVTLVSVVGDDTEGRLLADGLACAGVDPGGLVVEAGRHTLSLHRLRAAGQLVARFDHGTFRPPAAETEAALVAAMARIVPHVDVVVVSDYDKGVLGAAVRTALAQVTSAHPRPLVVDAKHPAAYRSLRPTAVKPNWAEAIAVLGSGELDGVEERAQGIAAQGDRLLELTGAQLVAVTLDSDGAIVFERGRPPHRTYAKASPDHYATGAGDTFVATLAASLAAGADGPTAAEMASAAAAVVVETPGTTTCTSTALEARMSGTDKIVHDPSRLDEVVADLRAAGRRVLFTNGCFDLLHRGHITYLNRAKTLGGVLMVGINSDRSIRRLKGESRPINTLDDRMSVLAALSCVDFVIPFDEDTPTDLLQAVRPDIYIKGGDYTADTLPEYDLVASIGGEVCFLPFMQDRSTTGIIDRIAQHAAGAAAPSSS